MCIRDRFVPALEAAVASGKPAVIHVRVDGELNTNAIGYEQFQYLSLIHISEPTRPY